MNAVARQPTSVGLEAQYAVVADRFAVAVTWADPRTAVPGCPGWAVRDLVRHLGNVHAWAATIVETGRPAVEHNDAPRTVRSARATRATRARLAAEWYRGKAEDLYEVLRSAAPDQPCWTLAEPDGVAGFWVRRQLHETTMHLVDLDDACGRTTTVDPHVAADGVDEVLSVWLPRRHRQGHVAVLDRPLALVSTDTADRWLLTPGAGGSPPAVRRLQGRADGAPDRVIAPAEVLYRLLWRRRVVASRVVVDGNGARARAFLGAGLTP